MDSSHLLRGLEQSGLNDKAAAIYTFLLETGGAYPSRIASETRINRSTVYKVLTDLSIKGLVNEIEKGKKLYYQIDRPSKLLRYTQTQATAANDRYERMKDLYPEIEGLFQMLPTKPKVLYFEGIDGVMSVYDDHIAGKKSYEMVGFADTERIQEFLPATYFKKYRQEKQRLKITTRGILPEGEGYNDYATKTYKDVRDEVRPALKFIPREKFPFRGEITIYGDSKVSVINLEGTQPSAIIIEDQSYHKMMRSIFELAWSGIN